MTKKLLLSSVLFLSLVVTGCGNKKNSSGDQPIPEQFDIAIQAAESKVGLFVGEERNINVFPEFRVNHRLKYTSLNPEIATVDENGKVTAVAQGSAKIAVQDLNRKNAGVFVDVQVVEKLKSREANKIYKAMKEIGESEVVDNFVDEEFYEKSVYKEGVRQSYTFWNQHMIYSKENAYFGIKETDVNIIKPDGAMTFSDYLWVFYTNEYYDSYTFHETHGQKNYYVAATADYIGQPRTQPLYDILDNIFVSGHKLYTQTFDSTGLSYVIDLAQASYSNVINQRGGSLGDGKLIFGCTITFDDETASIDDEKNYGIPYGTPTPASQDMLYVIENNKIVGYHVSVETNYEINGEHYKEIVNIDHNIKQFTEGNPELIYPNKDDYTLVDYLFAV